MKSGELSTIANSSNLQTLFEADQIFRDPVHNSYGCPPGVSPGTKSACPTLLFVGGVRQFGITWNAGVECGMQLRQLLDRYMATQITQNDGTMASLWVA
jgi:hypothetical protein